MGIFTLPLSVVSGCGFSNGEAKRKKGFTPRHWSAQQGEGRTKRVLSTKRRPLQQLCES